MLSRWAITGQEPKLMVNQSGGLETGASLGKYISCSQMWSGYFSSNKGDLKEGLIPDMTQGSDVWSFTKQDFQCCYSLCPSPSGFAWDASWGTHRDRAWTLPLLGEEGAQGPSFFLPQCTIIIFLIINICPDCRILKILDKVESEIPLTSTW